MFSAVISLLRRNKERFPMLYAWVVATGHKFIYRCFGGYPKVMSNEIGAVADVLRSGQWNMVYGKGLAHERLEAAFEEYVGVQHAIAVNTGGMALQMSMRALGLKPGHEVILQVDTCSATAFAVMNAGCTPIFSDISDQTFMLSSDSVQELIGSDTKAVIATHLWGNPENMAELNSICNSRDVFIIEDACLALGAKAGERMAGASGHVGVFSFGCLKPIQGGEGGMIVTNDDALARELRSLRHWGDRTLEYGVRDSTQLAWNGRMSEIVAAVVGEQLKGYPRHLSDLRDAVLEFQHYIEKIDGLDLVMGATDRLQDCAFTQIVLRFDERKFGHNKTWFRDELAKRGIGAWHANFELINSFSFFRDDSWKDWILKGDIDRVAKNFHSDFLMAQRVFSCTGIGLQKVNFLSRTRLRHLMKQIDALMVMH